MMMMMMVMMVMVMILGKSFRIQERLETQSVTSLCAQAVAIM